VSRITRAEVERIAGLAMLSLSDDEVERLAADLGAILDYAEELAGLDTSGVEPTSHVLPLLSPLRDDVPAPSLPPERVLAGAPRASEGAFVVPAVIEGGEG
jgi:aspartyl-tRNA(Asn)/glutamyl-tRNA(Gln) amidotransferase subunit C